MAHENVDVIREGVDAINAQDPAGFIACLHPDVVWEESGDVLPGLRGIYRGRAGARKWFEEAFQEVWESFHVQIEEITETNDGQVFLEALFTARGLGSGVETELKFWTVFWFANGKVARRRVFFTEGHAREAAGLTD